MDRTVIQETAVRELMQNWLDRASKRSNLQIELVCDEARKRFILMGDGWVKYRRLYGPLIDVALRGGKVWIYEDNTEDGITDDLLALGLGRDEIVVAWQPEYKRELTGFAVA